MDQPTIQAGINIAQPGGIVLVAPATYNENIDFHGKAITVTIGVSAYTSATAVINGVGDGPVARFSSGESSTSVLNGFILQNGHTHAASNVPGGGAFVDRSSPTITNNVITNNIGCGVLIVNGASPLIQGNDIKLSLYTNVLNLRPCASPDGNGVDGTGVAITGAGSPVLLSNVIEENALKPLGNSGESEGAGISIVSTHKVTIQGNIIRNNTADTEAAIGGQIANMAGSLILVQNLIYGNSGPGTQVFISGTYSGTLPELIETNNTIFGGGEELVSLSGRL